MPATIGVPAGIPVIIAALALTCPISVLGRTTTGKACGGILKSATISFGQSLDPGVIDRAMRAAERADLLLAIGSSLQVYPIAGAVPIAKAAGARVVIVNAEPTPFDDIADAVIHEPIGDVLPALCGCGASA